MQSEQIRPGLILRVISSQGLGAPVGSLATVKGIETSRSGDWMCIVEYHDKKQPRNGTRLYRSHLWISDLGRFEIVTGKQDSVGTMRKANPIYIQLLLQFQEEGDYKPDTV